jgi:lipopolysaccharide biosynthesis regulator YciM
MRIRTFLIIVLVLAVVFAVVYTLQSNAELIHQEFKLFGGVSIGIGWMLFWTFVAGVAITGFVGLAREMGLMIERWRLRRESRKSEEIEDEYSRGLVADMEGRDEEALRHFRAVLERDSRHFNTLIKLGEVQRDQGRYADAIEVHRKAHHLKPDDTRPLYALAEDHEAKGDMDRARAVVGKIIGLNKSSLAAWRKLRSLHAEEKNWESALEAQHRIEKLTRAGKKALDDADRRFGLGIRYEIASSHLAEGKTKEAIAGFRRVIKDNRTFIPA